MARTAGSNGPRTAAAIRRAGLRLIHRHGFEAMSLRALAAEVGLRPASLYNHFPTKQALLFGLIQDHMNSLLAETRAALAAAGPGAEARLRAFVAHHVAYHLERRAEVFVANFELRALEPANHARIVALRREYEALLIGILAEDGFDIPDARITAYAVLAMLTGACTWYRPDGRLDRAAVVALHTDLALRLCRPIGGPPAGEGAAAPPYPAAAAS